MFYLSSESKQIYNKIQSEVPSKQQQKYLKSKITKAFRYNSKAKAFSADLKS